MSILQTKKIYMIGIKGVGMTMLAQYLAGLGIEVSGSDTGEKFMTDKVLNENGIKISEKFDKNNIPPEVDLIIYSTAYNSQQNEELAAALSGKIKTLTYAEALAEIFNQKYGIAVVGSHGKTTTTAWLGYVLDRAGLSPSVMVGAAVPQWNGAGLIGRSDYLIIEADEYQDKLKYFQPRAVLLNNIDYDHPDFFPSEDNYKKTFIKFIEKIPKSGFLVANFDDPITKAVAGVNTRGKVISYSIKNSADFVAYDLKEKDGRQYFKVKLAADDENESEELADIELGDFSISLPGEHNIANALAVIATAVELNVDLYQIRQYLSEFSGTRRRLEYLGDFRGAAIIDDYAHHPTEIKASLSALKQKYPGRRLTLVFHPHTYSRTETFLDDFARSFVGIDELILLDIYGSAREKRGEVTSQDLMNKVVAVSGNSLPVQYLATLEKAEKYLRKHVKRDEVIVLMGAGDVFRIGQNLLK